MFWPASFKCWLRMRTDSWIQSERRESHSSNEVEVGIVFTEKLLNVLRFKYIDRKDLLFFRRTIVNGVVNETLFSFCFK